MLAFAPAVLLVGRTPPLGPLKYTATVHCLAGSLQV